jgi:starvation-inducible outer membrane lipoprotein
MKSVVKTNFLLLLMALMIAGCSSAPSPYSDPDSQRSRAEKAQDEMSR